MIKRLANASIAAGTQVLCRPIKQRGQVAVLVSVAFLKACISDALGLLSGVVKGVGHCRALCHRPRPVVVVCQNVK